MTYCKLPSKRLYNSLASNQKCIPLTVRDANMLKYKTWELFCAFQNAKLKEFNWVQLHFIFN